MNLNGSPANGLYDFSFSLSSNPQGSIITAGTAVLGVPVTNGLFITAIDFGAGQFLGTSNWLQIAVRTNLTGLYTNLSPLTLITPTPYAIFANTASNLSGTVPASHVSGTLGNAQLANSSVTVSAGTGLSGGGTVPLGGSTTLSNAGVLSVTGNADITATATGGAVTLGDTATNASLPDTNVTRDASGNFTNNNLTLTGNLILMGNNTMPILYGNNGNFPLISFGDNNFFAGSGNTANLGSFDTAVGYLALFQNKTGQYDTAVGYNALYAAGNTYGGVNDNTAIGANALTSDTGGYRNSAVGSSALYYNTLGLGNTALGYLALYANSSGSENTAIGDAALYNTTTANDNVAVGAGALYNSAGGPIIGLGFEAGQNITLGSSNIDIGNQGFSTDTNIIRIGSSQSQAYIAGVINGNGAGLTNLSVSALPADVALLDGNQSWTGGNSFYNAVAVNESQLGGYGSPVFLAQNNNTFGTTSPAIRAVGYGNSVNGVLSVSSEGTGLIAQFGNSSSFVADITTGGAFEGAGFTGGTLRVGTNGTTFATVQTGQALMPSGGSVLVATNLIITFPQPFTSIPKIIVSAANDPAFQNVNDTFAVSVSSNSVSAFRVNVVRVDAPTGWSQQLRINWQAWQ